MLTPKQQQLLTFIYQRMKENGVPPSFDEMRDALELKSKSGIHRLITGLEERGFIRRLRHRARAIEILKLPESSLPTPSKRGFKPSVVGGIEWENQHKQDSAADLDTDYHDHFDIDDSQSDLEHAKINNPSNHIELLSSDHSAQFENQMNSFSKDSLNQDSELLEAINVPVMGRIAAGTPIQAIQNQSRTISVPSEMIGNGEYYALEVRGDSMINAGILDGDFVVIDKKQTGENGDIIVALIDDEEATLKRIRRRGSMVALEAANPEYEPRLLSAERVNVQGRLCGLLRLY